MRKESHQIVQKNKLILQNASSTAKNYLEIPKSKTFLFSIKERTQEITLGGSVGLTTSFVKGLGPVI